MQTHKKTLFLNFGILSFLIFISLYYLLSEKVTVNDGFGWDGGYYAHLVSNVYDDLANQKVDSYYIRRILPSILVSIPAHLFNLPITREYIIYGFVIANILCIFISYVFWIKICRFFKMSFDRTVVSLILLFGFYWVLKGAAYYPVLTDIFAFTSSIVMLYFYLKENNNALATMILLSFFIWPSTVYIGSFLLLFPKGSYLQIEPKLLNTFTRISSISAISIMGIMGAVSIYGVFVKGWWKFSTDPFLLIKYFYLPLSILCVTFYVYYCIKMSMKEFKGNVKCFEFNMNNSKSIYYWLIIVGGCLILQYFLSPIKVTTGLNIIGLARGSISKPFIFLVSDITYYGAAAVLCILFFRPMLKQISNLGLGAYLTVLFSLVLNMYPESRFILNAFPFFVLGITLCGPFDHLTKKQWFLLIFTQFIFSKIWLPIGASPEFYFLNFGVCMSHSAYAVQAVVAIITMGVFYWYFIKNVEKKV